RHPAGDHEARGGWHCVVGAGAGRRQACAADGGDGVGVCAEGEGLILADCLLPSPACACLYPQLPAAYSFFWKIRYISVISCKTRKPRQRTVAPGGSSFLRPR